MYASFFWYNFAVMYLLFICNILSSIMRPRKRGNKLSKGEDGVLKYPLQSSALCPIILWGLQIEAALASAIHCSTIIILIAVINSSLDLMMVTEANRTRRGQKAKSSMGTSASGTTG